MFLSNELHALATEEIDLPRPGGSITFLVRALSPKEIGLASKLFPEPKPPRGFVYEKGSKTPTRDPKTDKPIMEYDFDDPDYLEACRETAFLRTMVQFLNAIDRDPKFNFAAGPKEETAEWYRAAGEEVNASGLSPGDMGLVIEKSNYLSNIDEGAPERAAEAFSARSQSQEQKD